MGSPSRPGGLPCTAANTPQRRPQRASAGSAASSSARSIDRCVSASCVTCVDGTQRAGRGPSGPPMLLGARILPWRLLPQVCQPPRACPTCHAAKVMAAACTSTMAAPKRRLRPSKRHTRGCAPQASCGAGPAGGGQAVGSQQQQRSEGASGPLRRLDPNHASCVAPTGPGSSHQGRPAAHAPPWAPPAACQASRRGRGGGAPAPCPARARPARPRPPCSQGWGRCGESG